MRTALVIASIFILGLAAALLGVSPPVAVAQDATSKPDVPPDAVDVKNPIPASPKSLEHGKKLFESQCTMCHGDNGDGSGDLAATLKMKVPDLTDPGAQKKRSDGEMFWIITYGHDRMPADGERFSPDLRWHMVNYVRTLDDPAQ